MPSHTIEERARRAIASPLSSIRSPLARRAEGDKRIRINADPTKSGNRPVSREVIREPKKKKRIIIPEVPSGKPVSPVTSTGGGLLKETQGIFQRHKNALDEAAGF